MKIRHRNRSAAYVRRLGGVCCSWLLCLALTGQPASAAENALSFNGTNQYVELPLGETIVVDNLGPGFAVPTGLWSASPATNACNGSSLQTTSADATATWTPVLPRAGRYDVYAWWSGVLSNGAPAPRDTMAQYVVKHGDSLATNVVDQNMNSGKWFRLGTFDFNADKTEYVIVRRGNLAGGPTVADAVRFVNQEAFNFTNTLTLEAWIQVAAFDKKDQAIISKGEAWGLLRYNDTAQITFRTSDGEFAHDLVSTQELAAGQWYHVAAVYDGSRKQLFVNGTLSASATYTAALAQNLYPVLIGGNAEVAGRDFHGAIDNVRLWSSARAASDLQACWTNRLRGSEAGLLGEWRFDEAGGLTALDSSAGAMHGALRKTANPPVRVAGVAFGPPLPGALALQFNGYDQFTTVPDAPKFDFTTQCTLETWVYLDFAPASPVALISKGADAWELTLAANSKIVFHTSGTTAEDPSAPTNRIAAPDLVSATRLDPGAWTHIAAVWDAAAGRKDIYVNGQLDASATNLQGAITANNLPVLFAARPSAAGASELFRGTLDEVRLWSLARTGPQIGANFPRDLNRTEPALAGFWDCNEGTGLIIRDGHLDGASDGALNAAMSDLNRVAGMAVGLPLPLQYSLTFNGLDEYIQIGQAGALDIYNLTNLTIEAWVKPTGSGFRNILMKGDHGYGLAIDGNNYLRYFIDSTTQNSLRSSLPLELERDADGNPRRDVQGNPIVAWNHVGVVVDRAANTTTFYLNGKPAGSYPSSIIRNNTGPLFLGRQGTYATTNFYQGQMDEVRLWNLPRTSLEVQLFAFNSLRGMVLPGLIGYWSFNEGSGLVLQDGSGGGHDGTLVNMGAGNWREGTDWGVPPLEGGMDNLVPNPNAAGLWIGQVVLSKVNEVQKAVQGASEVVTDTADQASVRILLHVAANGQVRMLKDVIIMQQNTATNAPANSSTNPLPPANLAAPTNTALVLITNPELIPNYQGVARRGDKLVGLRYGTVAYDFEGADLPLLGGVGAGTVCLGRIDLAKDHPTNPYRHKYHPDHRSGFDLTRQFTIHFDGAPGDPLREGPGYGVDRLTGVYRETVIGLHKIPLKVEGLITLNRINTVPSLNGTP